MLDIRRLRAEPEVVKAALAKRDPTLGEDVDRVLEVDERRLGAFSSQASIAIENAQLFEEIMRMKNYNESILESMSSGVITLNADSEVVTANAAALKLFRLEEAQEHILGRAAAAFFAGPNTWVAESIEKVRESLEQEIAMDTDLWVAARGEGPLDERQQEVRLT